MTPSQSASAWSLAGHHAACRAAGPASAVDLDRPRTGIEVRRRAGREADCLLGLELDESFRCVDAWCRGTDLTAVYESGAEPRLRATVMWRAPPAWAAPAAATGVCCREAVVSVQTSLLESAPQLVIHADVARTAVTAVTWHAGRLAAAHDQSPHGFVVAGPDDDVLLFLVHPADARAARAVVSDDRVRMTAALFPAVVEKGVLLRGRVVAALGPAAPAAVVPDWAGRIAAAFAASPPVLTT